MDCPKTIVQFTVGIPPIPSFNKGSALTHNWAVLLVRIRTAFLLAVILQFRLIRIAVVQKSRHFSGTLSKSTW